jgi:fermentation-respiration switch protein FrsA (DUF1100 family)
MPTLSEYEDVLDWRTVTVLRALDEDLSAGDADAIVAVTDLDRETVEDSLRQLSALGLVEDGSEGYALTDRARGPIDAGLYDRFDLAGGGLDDLAAEVATLLDRRDAIRGEVADLREDVSRVQSRADGLVDDDEVDEELDRLLDSLDSLAAALDDEQ